MLALNVVVNIPEVLELEDKGASVEEKGPVTFCEEAQVLKVVMGCHWEATYN